MSKEDSPRPNITELGRHGPAPQRPPAADATQPDQQEQARQFAIEAARTAHDLHCHEVLVLDLRNISDVTDYIVLASGTSDRQVRSVADDLEELAGQHDLARFGRDVDEQTTWIVLDLVNVVIHLFDPPTRAYYDLEMMWGDAPRVPWKRDENASAS